MESSKETQKQSTLQTRVKQLVNVLNQIQADDNGTSSIGKDAQHANAIFEAMELPRTFTPIQLETSMHRAEALLWPSVLQKAGLPPDDSSRLQTNLDRVYISLSDSIQRATLQEMASQCPVIEPRKHLEELTLPAVDHLKKMIENDLALREARRAAEELSSSSQAKKIITGPELYDLLKQSRQPAVPLPAAPVQPRVPEIVRDKKSGNTGVANPLRFGRLVLGSASIVLTALALLGPGNVDQRIKKLENNIGTLMSNMKDGVTRFIKEKLPGRLS